MIICNSKNYIYIHIPKCGGSTVGRLLHPRQMAQDISLAYSMQSRWAGLIQCYSENFNLKKHSRVKEICRAIGGESFLKKYRIISTCRNPYSRAYSAYTFTLSDDAKKRPESKRHQDTKDMSFVEFLKSEYMDPSAGLQAALQTSWFEGFTDSIDLYKLEDFDLKAKELMHSLGYLDFQSTQVAVVNQSAPRNEWLSMPDEAASIIKDRYSEDFKVLGYNDNIEFYRAQAA